MRETRGQRVVCEMLLQVMREKRNVREKRNTPEKRNMRDISLCEYVCDKRALLNLPLYSGTCFNIIYSCFLYFSAKAPNLPPGVMPLYGMQPAPGFPGFSVCYTRFLKTFNCVSCWYFTAQFA